MTHLEATGDTEDRVTADTERVNMERTITGTVRAETIITGEILSTGE